MSEMKLTLDQLRLITSGAIQITQEEDGFHFFRFTEAQMALEHPYVPWLMQKHRATAGICLSFRTDSSILHLCADMTVGSGRPYYALDVVVNGTRIGGIDNFSHLELPADYTELPLERHIHTADFPLGTGEKDVRIYLPWGACTVLKELALENGASLIPQMPEKKLLVFGDSITQGYDALYPSRHYVPRLGQALNAQVYNKALGGAISFPELAAARKPFDPDYVLVAYGTNDWRKIPLTDHLRRYRALLTAIRNNYPGAQFFCSRPSGAKTLMWRGGRVPLLKWRAISAPLLRLSRSSM